MKLSDRITGLVGKGGDGWGLFLKARAMIAAGQDVTELTIGEHDIGTAPEILAAMDRAAQDGHTGYAMVPGMDALRDKVAARIQAQSGVPTGRDNVLIVPGGQSGLFATHMTVCDPGDRALFIDPYYATYPGTIRAASAIPVPVQARAEDQFQPDLTALDAAAEGARSLLINTPNNPTGVIYNHETLAGISEVIRGRDMWLISDEVYDTQIWDGAHISPRALPEMAGRTLVIGSMSKSHAMTGSRIGWVIGP
ncbi:MAG TPA: aminotransferase class I/II-fold pyridoxal phosphate-dependent enzyme, partial [Aliiroseovarius sp.]|nr:aminotransferase class I/II-fold pyridoxal phosphate-dependent enzyme [Aliiroseovarius sp.]